MIVVDTHALVWWSANPERLSRRAFDAMAGADIISFSTMTIFEIGRLLDRKRIAFDRPTNQWFSELIENPMMRVIPVTTPIAARAATLIMHGDPADRLIVATALEHHAALVTKDDRIQRAGVVETIW